MFSYLHLLYFVCFANIFLPLYCKHFLPFGLTKVYQNVRHKTTGKIHKM
nr:MAG TPA: hypothetical protein [Caudoviricetes sp.]